MSTTGPSRRTANRQYEHLLLDLGGVCLLNPVELHHVAEAAFGLDPGTLIWKGPVDPSTDELWRTMVAGGVLTERDYWEQRAQEIGRLAGISLDTVGYMEALYTPASDDLMRDECYEVVNRAFDKGMSVSILTNDMSAFHGPEWKNGISLCGQVEHLVDCSHYPFLKPDPRAYTTALETLGAEPDKVLFVDDQPLNCAGAIDADIDTIWFDIGQPLLSWQRVADAIGVQRP